MKKTKNKPDYILLGIVALLLSFGILILASISAPFSLRIFGNTYYILKHQIIYGLIPGLIFGFIAFKMNISFIKKITPFLFLFNLILLALVFVPYLGYRVGETARWINVGPISFQPAEFLKVTFILYLASWLSSSNNLKKKPSQIFLTFFVILGIVILSLIFQPDISTLAVILIVALIMYFVHKTPFWHTLVIILTGGIGLFTLIKISDYHAQRFLVFLNPETDPMGIGYQLKQALIAIGSGRITGVGLGLGVQKLGLLPQTIADSIFAVFAEEAGFVGALFLISLFLLFLWRGLKIAKEAPDSFSQLVALGITSWIIFQAFINIGAMISLLPLTGIPLPFVSYGGSALFVLLVGIGILLNVSRE